MKTLEKINLVQNEREAIEAAVKKLKKEFLVDKIVLFGSKARGEADQHSDIDLLIVTSHPLHWKEEKAIVEILFDIGLQYNVIFSSIFSSNDEWENGLFGQFPIYHEIIKDGAVIA